MKTINIHGKEYVPVSERVKEAHEKSKTLSITTEVLPVEGSVVIKATVITAIGTFTGISAANPAKAIEKASPYEVAETSAVGRALAFAGFGVIDSISSADEMKNAIKTESPKRIPTVEEFGLGDDNQDKCAHCGSTGIYHAKQCPNFNQK